MMDGRLEMDDDDDDDDDEVEVEVVVSTDERLDHTSDLLTRCGMSSASFLPNCRGAKHY